MEFIFSALIGYLIGSIPTAFLILKYAEGKDIREHGSGNVGTLNSYEITNSKKIGVSVLLVDLLKGISAVITAKIIIGDEFIILITALNSAVFGHCYSVWLKFKGGRGLATAAGGALILSPFILLFWLISWYLSKKVFKDIHIANVSATAFVIILVLVFPNFLNNFTFPSAQTNFIFGFSISLLMIIIFSKHIGPIVSLIKNKQEDL